MSRTKPKRLPKSQSVRVSVAHADIVAAERGLHGSPLGAGQFIRALRDKTLADAFSIHAIMALITMHALAIVDGNPDGGIDEERANLALSRAPIILQRERVRRFGLIRIRYPRDPFTGIPNIWWCTDHPYVQLLYSIPENTELKKKICNTGDLTLLSGHFLLLPPERQRELVDRLEEMDKNLDHVLAEIEEEFADSETLAEIWEKPFLVKT